MRSAQLCKQTPKRQLTAKEILTVILNSCAKPCMEDDGQSCCYIPEAIQCAPDATLTIAYAMMCLFCTAVVLH